MSEPTFGDRDHLRGEDYRALFEALPISVWVQDFSAVKQAVDELRAQGASDVHAHLLAHADELRRIAHLVRVLQVNESAVDLFGAASKDDLLAALSDGLIEGALPRFAEQVAAVAEGSTSVEVEGSSRTLSGEPLDVIVRWSVIPGHQTTYDRVVVSMIDVTALRNAEHDLRASEQHFRSYFERAMIGMATTSRDKTWLEVNRQLGDILGYEPQELVGMTWLQLTHPDDREREEAEYDRIFAGETDGYSLEKRYVHRDGHIVEAHTALQCVRGEDGEVIACVALVEDVTAQRQMEREILALNAELERRVDERTTGLRTAVEQLESFAYSVAHDLRTPLRAVDGYSAALLQDHSGELDEVGLDYAKKLRAGAQRMASLIDDLLALARASSGSMRIADVDLTSIAHFVVGNVRARDPRPGVRMIIPDGMRALADPGLIAVVLQNLLGNAWKYTAGVERARIELGVVDSGERVFFVSDNGCGFDAAVAGRLFTPFEVLQGSVGYEAGTGMGLAVVERVVRRHGGRCWAEGSPGKGATFSFTLAPPPEQSESGEPGGGAPAGDATA